MKNYISVMRPKTLIAVLFPILFVTYYGAQQNNEIQYKYFFICVTVGIFIQISTNLFNDYFDFLRGADFNRIGPKRFSHNEQFRKTIWKMALGALVISFLASIPLFEIHWLSLIFALFSMYSSYRYTGGSRPFAYHGLGVFGFVLVYGTTYAVFFTLTPGTLEVAFIFGILNTLILCANNLRDFEGDQKVHKNTLAVKMGIRNYRLFMMILVVLSLFISFKISDHISFLVISSFLSGLYLVFLFNFKSLEKRVIFFKLTLLFYLLNFVHLIVNLKDSYENILS